MESENDFYWFCETVRTSRIPGSVRRKIDNPYLAEMFDNAVAIKVREIEKQRNEELAYLIASKTWGNGETGTSYEDNPEVW